MNFSFNKIQLIDTCNIIPIVEFLYHNRQLYMNMFWNKHLSVLKFCLIYVAMLPKFFYSQTWNSQVLERFLVLIIFKTSKKYLRPLKFLSLRHEALGRQPPIVASKWFFSWVASYGCFLEHASIVGANVGINSRC
jgi:hypothetical protein